jgi:uncharacterized protein (DUF433 family)
MNCEGNREAFMEYPGIDHICGPRIAGTRITVYDVFYYLQAGWREADIAQLFKLTVEQIQAATRYIEANKEEVLAVHDEVEARNARGNPPEIQAMLEESHARLMALVEERRKARSTEANGEGHPGGR